MGLNIKNEQVHAAVRELAHRLGVSQTSAVEQAVRASLASLDHVEGGDRAARVERAAAAAQQAYRGVDLRGVEAGLYDETTGLAR